MPSTLERIAERAVNGQLMRAEDLGVSDTAMSRAYKAGVLTRLAPGVYRGTETAMPEHPLAAAAAWSIRYPAAVFGLVTMAAFYDYTDAFSRGLWMIVEKGTSVPRSRTTPLQVIQSRREWVDPTQDSANGVETLTVHGQPVRVTGRDRTVVDLWRFTARVPYEHAIGALTHHIAWDAFDRRRFARLAVRLGAWRKLEPIMEGVRIRG